MPSHVHGDKPNSSTDLATEAPSETTPTEQRALAGEALDRLGAEHPDAVPALVQALSHQDAAVRISAIQALAQSGKNAVDAVPALVDAVASGEPATRLQAALALREISPSTPVNVGTVVDALETQHLADQADAGSYEENDARVDGGLTATRTLAALEEIGSAIRSTLDMDEILDVIAPAVVDAGEFRSLMVALVDEDSREVRVERDYVRDAAGIVSRGGLVAGAVTYARDDRDPVAEAARTGRIVVTEGWDERLTDRDPEITATYPADKIAYFIPITHEGRTSAVLATASTAAERDATMDRISGMAGPLRHAGAALEHARVQQRLALLREELRAVVAGARCLLWHARVRVDTPEEGEPRLEWDMRVADEDAAQRFLPLDTSGGRAYVHAWDEALGPREVARVSVAARRAILAGESGYEVEYGCTDATGSERWLSERVFIEHVKGAEWRCVGVCSDITEWKRAEATLLDSEDRFRGVFRQGPWGIGIVGPDFRLVDANDLLCRMVGYTRDELCAMRFADFTHEEDIAKDVELMRQVFAGEIPHYSVEKRYVAKDGTLVWGKVTATVIGGAREPTRSLHMIEDITLRKHAEHETPDLQAQLEQRIEERTAEIEDELAERIRVEGALRTTERERTRLMQQILNVQEEERTRIARELHDQTGQALSSLLIGLRLVEGAPSLATVREHAAELREVTSLALDSVRTLAFDMRPTSLDDLGLSAGVEREASALGSRLGIRAQVHADAGVDDVLPPDAEGALYRVIHAALTNIGRHASATTISILLRRREDAVTAVVEDDGVGFDVEEIRNGPIEGRFGLLAMEERVRPFRGTVSFESAPGEGATVYVHIPAGLSEDAPD